MGCFEVAFVTSVKGLYVAVLKSSILVDIVSKSNDLPYIYEQHSLKTYWA